jgi:hypothetical protein
VNWAFAGKTKDGSPSTVPQLKIEIRIRMTVCDTKQKCASQRGNIIAIKSGESLGRKNIGGDMDSETIKRSLRIKRKKLFAEYVADPKNVQLASTIKALDDEIAELVAESTSRQRSTTKSPRLSA